jgi:hypothetical protein
MNRETLAQFLLQACPMANRRMFVTDSVIQVDGLDESGKIVLRRLLALPNGEIADIDMGWKEK